MPHANESKQPRLTLGDLDSGSNEPRGEKIRFEKSAEVVVGEINITEGLNRKETKKTRFLRTLRAEWLIKGSSDEGSPLLHNQMTMINQVVERENLIKALKRVRANKGAPGVDGMTVDELGTTLKTHWPRIKQELRSGTYTPQAVRAVEIPKPRGGVRVLGILCVVDRPWKRSFLGHTMTQTQSRLIVSPQSVKRAKDHLRRVFQKGRGWKLSSVIREVNTFSRGWTAYYVYANQWSVYQDLDGWIRRRIRWLLWRQWKRKRFRIRKLIALGLDEKTAKHWGLKNRGPWWHSKQSHLNSTITNTWLENRGLVSLFGEHRRLSLSVSS